MQTVHASLIDRACWSKADLVCSQLVIEATPPQLLLLFGQHPSDLFLGLRLFLGDIVLALLLKLGALHMYDLLGILSKGGPIQNVQCQLNLHQQWSLSMHPRAQTYQNEQLSINIRMVSDHGMSCICCVAVT